MPGSLDSTSTSDGVFIPNQMADDPVPLSIVVSAFSNHSWYLATVMGWLHGEANSELKIIVQDVY